MDVGTDLSIMIEVGVSMEEFHFGIIEYHEIGEKITETIFGEVIHGITITYTIMTSKETGEAGIILTIGTNQSIENLHTVMMESRTVLVNIVRLMLIKDMVQIRLTKEPHRENLTKVP